MSAAVLEARAMSRAAAMAAAEPLLKINPEAFRGCFNRRPFLIRHRLCEHPLFDLQRLLNLARTLPESHIEYNSGKLPVNQEQALTPRNGQPAEFDQWRWERLDRVADLVVPFRRDVYRMVAQCFAKHAATGSL